MRGLLALLALIAALIAPPALASRLPRLSSCSVSDPAARSPVSLARHTRENGSPYFEATAELSVVAEGKGSTSAYLVRQPDQKGWQIWIEVFDERSMGQYPLGIWDRADLRAPLAEEVLNGDHGLFKLDLAGLLKLGESGRLVHLVVGSPTAIQSGKSRKVLGLTLDLQQLRSSADWARYLSDSAAAGTLACDPIAKPLDEVVDPAAYTECDAAEVVDNVRVATVRTFDGEGFRLSWGSKVSPGLFVHVDQILSGEQFAELLALPETERTRTLWAMVAPHFRFNRLSDENGNPQDYSSYTIRFEVGGVVMQAPLLQINRLTRSAEGLDMLNGREAIAVTLSGPKMPSAQTEILPAGLFRNGAVAMISAMTKLEAGMSDPVTNCTIPGMIVVT